MLEYTHSKYNTRIADAEATYIRVTHAQMPGYRWGRVGKYVLFDAETFLMNATVADHKCSKP